MKSFISTVRSSSFAYVIDGDTVKVESKIFQIIEWAPESGVVVDAGPYGVGLFPFYYVDCRPFYSIFSYALQKYNSSH